MIKGFTFFLFLFTTPEQAISNKLDGYWYVTEDSTIQRRDLFRFFRFEKCEKFEDERLCYASYGWSKNPDNYKNFRDAAAFSYNIIEDESKKKQFILRTDLNDYNFLLDLKNDALFLKDETSKESLAMVKLKLKRRDQ